ncbi:hypothetical protein DAPPUDRAFT_335016 [Daphnia pulex]|uniref:Myb/SANT-like DNA-binding domain-containing protein n=1 Tax=Daphnia pulex TaxID=6669 RepID=E9HWX0_DAPPU|nr:hypothetical protein DAPPUDRAFT_335016 [Daphnia pulex]|eukprot:EFX63761.1 hypothetical protein DAPPUDRAFT_335016 [Daphnia pulex]
MAAVQLTRVSEPYWGQQTSNVLNNLTGIGKEMSKGIGPSIIQVAQNPCFIEIGKGQNLADASRNLPSHGRGWSKEMEPSTSQVARQCGASRIEMDQPNVRVSTILTVAGRGRSKGSNLSVGGVQDACGTNQQARGGHNSRILPNRGSPGTCSQLTRGRRGGCGAINKEARGGRFTSLGGRGTTSGGRGTTRGGQGTTRGVRKTIFGPNPPTPTQTISASQVNYAEKMENELFTLDNDDNNEDLLFRDLDNFDGAETDYPNANPQEVEQEVGGGRDEDEDNGENDDLEESEEEGFRFTVEKSKLLLDAYKKFQEKMMSGRQKKKTIWTKIANYMESMGHAGLTGRICEIKFKNMKAQYKNIKKRNGQTGRGGPPSWPYFDTMDELLRHDLAVNPQNIAEIGAAGINYIPRRADHHEVEGEIDDEYEPPAPKRKRISNGETIQMMMIAKAERSSVNNRFLDVLKGIQAQGDEKVHGILSSDT